MIDPFTLEQCRKNKEILNLKIKSLEFAISQSEAMISESQMDYKSLTFLRSKVAQSHQDLEILYLIRKNDIN